MSNAPHPPENATNQPGPRFRSTSWAILHGQETHRFRSLSEMGRWSLSNLSPTDVVTLQHDGKTIFCGLWGGGLTEDPTLL